MYNQSKIYSDYKIEQVSTIFFLNFLFKSSFTITNNKCYNGQYKFVNKEIDIISLFQGMSINMYKYIFVVFKVFFIKKYLLTN